MKSLQVILKLSLMMGLISLAACDEVEFRNGRVPAEYVAQAQASAGTFKGKFLGQEGELTLSLQDDVALLTYNSDKGNDLLGNECQSRIGHLKKARIKDNKRITHLYFSFNAGKCDIPGRELDLEFSKDYKRITLYLEDYDSITQECEWVQRNPPAPPIYECRNFARKRYFTGSFVR